MKEIVQHLYNLIVQGYDHHGAPSIAAMKGEMYGAPPWHLTTGEN